MEKKINKFIQDDCLDEKYRYEKENEIEKNLQKERNDWNLFQLSLEFREKQSKLAKEMLIRRATRLYEQGIIKSSIFSVAIVNIQFLADNNLL